MGAFNSNCIEDVSASIFQKKEIRKVNTVAGIVETASDINIEVACVSCYAPPQLVGHFPATPDVIIVSNVVITNAQFGVAWLATVELQVDVVRELRDNVCIKKNFNL